MSDTLLNNYKGLTISIAITGLPIIITGKLQANANNIVTLKADDGKIINIAKNLISFFF